MPYTSLKVVKTFNKKSDCIVISNKNSDWKILGLTPLEIKFIQKAIHDGIKPVVLHRGFDYYFFIHGNTDDKGYRTDENWRKDANKVIGLSNELKLEDLTIINITGEKRVTSLVMEGALLGNYQFLKYKTKNSDSKNSLKSISVLESSIEKKDLAKIETVTIATQIARDLVNEPLSYLTAVQLSNEIKVLGKKAGFSVDVLNKAKIKSLKMGGLLAVNLGSPNPPTFNILEWKPKNAKNKKPLILVGKGVVYDTGGLSLKPTPGSMDQMKCDMAGAAAVAGTFYAVAKAKLPVHVIGLIPATENRPGGNAYVPGDVIKMHSGMTVEVLNTDAEGRMILADALSYAKKYDPELVIDLATLTGAAARAIGPEGIVFMGSATDEVKEQLQDSGNAVYERLVEFPLWEEYEAQIKSDIADIKNIGGPMAGAITAGIFLKRFTDYPWLHLDIAGGAFLTKDDSYRKRNGTGLGVRLLFDFIQTKAGK